MKTLSDIYPLGSTVLAKYPEVGVDNKDSKFKFLAWAYGPEVIHTEEARFLPVVGSAIQVLTHNSNLVSGLVDYYEHTYPDTFDRRSLVGYGAGEHIEVAKRVVNQTLFTLHPYSDLDTQKYRVHPDLVFGLNDKTQMSQLTEKILGHLVIENAEFDRIRSMQPPFVIKAHSGASGDGVRIIRESREIHEALNYFASEAELMVEQYAEIENNYNIQWAILSDWTVRLLGISEQYTTPEGEYNGNLVPKTQAVPTDVADLFYQVGNKAAMLWFIWVFGLDIIRTVDDEVFLIDPNFRLNGSTSTLLLKERIFAETESNFLRFGSFSSDAPSVRDLLSAVQKRSGEVYILAAFQNQSSGRLRWYAITHWKEVWDIEARTKSLQSVGIFM